jgi:nucleoid-associated protein YgaU
MQADPPVPAAPEDADDMAEAAPSPSEPEPETEPGADAPDAAPPSFDVVRVAPDGGALVAGAAAPGASLVLRVDGVAVAETVADANGQFVVLFMLDPTSEPQTMTLESRRGDGRVEPSLDTVILAPRAPVALAALEDAPTAPPPDAAADDAAGSGPAPALPDAQTDPQVGEAEAAHLPSLPEPTAPEPDAIALGAAPEPPQDADRDPPAGPVADLSATGVPDADPPVGDSPALAVPDAVTAGDAPAMADADLPAPGPRAESRSPGLHPSLPRPAPRVGGTAPALVPPETGPTAAAPPGVPPVAPSAASDDLPALAAAGPEATSGAALSAAADLSDPAAAERAASLPPAFVLRQGGAVEVSGPAPQPADAVVIDAISYSDTGAVQISGRAGQDDPEARVQLYLDNQPLALAQAERGTWSVAVPELAPGLYTLRADQLGADGRVATRFETPFQRASPEDATRPPARPGREGEASAQIVTVQPGNSLWRISREHYGEGVRYVQIYQANVDQIRDPDLIYPGQIFVLPD